MYCEEISSIYNILKDDITVIKLNNISNLDSFTKTNPILLRHRNVIISLLDSGSYFIVSKSIGWFSSEFILFIRRSINKYIVAIFTTPLFSTFGETTLKISNKKLFVLFESVLSLENNINNIKEAIYKYLKEYKFSKVFSDRDIFNNVVKQYESYSKIEALIVYFMLLKIAFELQNKVKQGKSTSKYNTYLVDEIGLCCVYKYQDSIEDEYIIID